MTTPQLPSPHGLPRQPHRRPGPAWRVAPVLCALAALLALAACGPGVGGTGTGQEHSATDFGAVAAPLCTSPLVAQLSCPAPVEGAAATVGSLPLLLADASPPQRASGRIDGSRIELVLACDHWSFFGEWGVGARTPDGRFYGTGRGPGGRVQPAVLQLVAVAGGGFLATLQDANGQALVAPVLLQVVTRADGAPACGA